ncbi:MAG: radical SAM protein, partial [Kiritimatiellia bacterium]|nr:radical SAM protein [Kiritimatiellia bacterium]
MDSDFAECRLCPRICGVDRNAGKTGVCGETAECRVGAAVAHFGEEPPISGTRGSGTIFFSGCSCHCFFCQNHQISTGREGRVVSADELAALARKGLDLGVHNLNFVTPDHVWPHIETLCDRLRAEGR